MSLSMLEVQPLGASVSGKSGRAALHTNLGKASLLTLSLLLISSDGFEHKATTSCLPV